MAGTWDVIVCGGGSAGIPCATFAAKRGARVLVIEQSDRIGGTLFVSGGQMAAAGTKAAAVRTQSLAMRQEPHNRTIRKNLDRFQGQ